MSVVIIALSLELIAGVLIAERAWRLRWLLIEVGRQLADVKALRRRLENPELPADVLECISGFAQATGRMGQGRKLLGQVLADKMRTTLNVPDATLAAALHDVLWAADKVADTPADGGQFQMLLEVLAAATVELCWLEQKELAP